MQVRFFIAILILILFLESCKKHTIEKGLDNTDFIGIWRNPYFGSIHGEGYHDYYIEEDGTYESIYYYTNSNGVPKKRVRKGIVEIQDSLYTIEFRRKILEKGKLIEYVKTEWIIAQQPFDTIGSYVDYFTGNTVWYSGKFRLVYKSQPNYGFDFFRVTQ